MIPERRALSPKNVMLDLLRMTRHQPISTKSLVETGTLFGFNSNAVRVALTRLVSQGMVESDERGLYRLSLSTNPMNQLIEDWRKGDARRVNWSDQSWLVCHLSKCPNRSERNHSVKALSFQGFKEGLDNLWVRPNNLALPFDELLERLNFLGLENNAALFSTRDIDGAIAERWRHQLWNPTNLKRAYRESLAKLKKSEKKLLKMPTREAMIESFYLGGEAIHILVKDPLLPDEIFQCEDREHLCETMLHYDTVGRSIWAKEVSDLPAAENPPQSSNNIRRIK